MGRGGRWLSVHRFVDGGKRTADSAFGLVNTNGANTRTTDLAPGTAIPMVCSLSLGHIW
jgi:hypothetical protein